MKDTIFQKVQTPANFEFNQSVADVFDDMLDRSVPFYQQVQKQLCELAALYAKPGTNIYHLGSSLGSTCFRLSDHLQNPEVRIVGIDNSESMVKKAHSRLSERNARNVSFRCADMTEVEFENASVVIVSLTLQFLRPAKRVRMLEKIYEALNPGGALLLFEKVICPDSSLNQIFIKNYYHFKEANGYSQTEIAEKRKALENVLIPYSYEENCELVSNAGFSIFECFFRWYNFMCLLAIKK